MKRSRTSKRPSASGSKVDAERSVTNPALPIPDSPAGISSALILAAGYATRLRPHIKNTPKALLPLGGTPLIDTILDRIIAAGSIKFVRILTNHLHYPLFEKWRNRRSSTGGIRLELHSDETITPEESAGAVGNLLLGIREFKSTESVLVLGGDTFLDLDLRSFLREFEKESSPLIAVHSTKNPTQFGIVELDKDNYVKKFVEKPPDVSKLLEPYLASVFCYAFTSEVLRQRLKDFVQSASNSQRDEMGNYIEYLHEKGVRIRGYPFDKHWFDVGHLADYRTLNQIEILRQFSKDESRTFRQSLEAVILFADIIDSAAIAEFTSDEDYDALITEFQSIALEVIRDNLSEARFSPSDGDECFWDYYVRGDEAMVILYTHDQGRDARTALNIAVELKRKFFLSQFNRERRGRSYFDLGIGIHCGNVVLGKHPRIASKNSEFNAEGYSISVAKRIEGESRKGKYSKIILSKRFLDVCPAQASFSERIEQPLKGVYGAISMYELQAYESTSEDDYIEAKALRDRHSVIKPEDINYYEAALESCPYDLWLLLKVAQYYFDLEDFESAQNFAIDAISRNDNFAVAHLLLGRCYYREGHYSDALKSLTRAVQLAPESSTANNFLAVTHRRLKEYAEAIQRHEIALRLSPNSPFTHNAMAFTLAEACCDDPNDLEKAKNHLDLARQYFRLTKGPGELAYLLDHTDGLIQWKSKRFRDSIARYVSALKSVNNNTRLMPREKVARKCEILYHLGVAQYDCSQDCWKDAEASLVASLTSDLPGRRSLTFYWQDDATRRVNIIRSTRKS